MGSIRFRGYSLAFTAILLWGCGSGDSGGLIGVPGTDAGQSDGQSNGSGGRSGVDASAGGGTGGAKSAGGSSGRSAGGSSGDGAGGGGSGGDGGASTDGGQADAGGSGPVHCGAVTCDPAATCTAAKCTCGTGYTDTNGDGTECLKDNGGTCSSDSECTNTHCVGGSCCAVACTTPGACEKVGGTVCVGGTRCQYGKQPDVDPVTQNKTLCDDGNACTTNSCFNGTCVVDNTKSCDDSNKCTNDSCNPTTAACSNTTLVCNDNNPCTSDVCSAAVGCQFTPNTAACDDGDLCTTADICAGGACKGAAKDCSPLTTACATGACVAATGACQATPKNFNGPCANGIDACSTAGTCNGLGACVGDNKACGAIATSCVTCASGVQCFGAPTGHDCTCPATSGGTPVIEQNGKCVLNNDECINNPCGLLATSCSDPTPSATPASDYVCTCGAGTMGNTIGSACVDKNECVGGPNPCGAGVCTNANPPQKYTCACDAGFKSTPTPTGPVCACDMSGTFVESVTTMVSWNNIGGGVIANPPVGGVAAYAWSLRQQTIAADGTMTAVTVPCGGVAPTLCDTSSSHLAYAQYQPVGSWGKTKMRSGFPVIGPLNLATTVPGGSYVEPEAAAILGLDLKDPAGTWPPCRACIGPSITSCTCGGTIYAVTNPATWWSDAEGTGKLGVTTVAVPQGGDIIGDVGPFTPTINPPINYGLPSECPRPTGGSDYTAWPGFVFPTFFTTYKWYGASRIISGLTSTSISNACVITGNVTGPDAGKAHSDARVAGCEKGTNAAPAGQCREPTAGAPADPDEVGFYDGVTQSQQILGSTFTLERPPASITPAINLGAILAMAEGAAKENAVNAACQAVRSNVKYCPPGKTCQ